VGLGGIFAAAVVAAGLALASILANRRASRTEAEERLDSDALGARMAWAADVVTLAGVALTALASAVVKLRADGEIEVVSTIAFGVTGVSGLLLVMIAANLGSDYVNRYPESFYQMVTFGRTAGPSRARLLTPGVAASFVLSIILAAASLAAREVRTTPSDSPMTTTVDLSTTSSSVP
jgi:hypothetical protein